MTTHNLPDLSDLEFDQLQELQGKIEERIDTIRQKFIEDAAALGLSLDGRTKRKPRRNSHRQQHQE